MTAFIGRRVHHAAWRRGCDMADGCARTASDDGFIASFVRPGGNITGFTNIESSLGGSWSALRRSRPPSGV